MAGTAVDAAISIPVDEDAPELSGDMDSMVAAVSKGEIPDGLFDKVKSTFNEKRKNVKPWQEFADVRRASKPKTFGDVTSRVTHNVSKYSANYFFIWVTLVLYCLLTSPLLIVAFGFLGVTVGLIAKGGGERRIGGYTFSREDQLKFCAAMTIPLLYISGATGTIFWVVGATLAIVLAHAAVMPPQDDADAIIQDL
mmetsp:Transcript_4941/g.12832  ORF Transcript_4941/g.12832 Transcript_4941/m.12832 type:complete len:196 (+) Transcript_4941:43-630(+)